MLSLVNAGHLLPLLIRRTSIEEVVLPADLPFGLNDRRGYRVTEAQFQPGDRVVMVTDGTL